MPVQVDACANNLHGLFQHLSISSVLQRHEYVRQRDKAEVGLEPLQHWSLLEEATR
jgi:hypothetical protein